MFCFLKSINNNWNSVEIELIEGNLLKKKIKRPSLILVDKLKKCFCFAFCFLKRINNNWNSAEIKNNINCSFCFLLRENFGKFIFCYFCWTNNMEDLVPDVHFMSLRLRQVIIILFACLSVCLSVCLLVFPFVRQSVCPNVFSMSNYL